MGLHEPTKRRGSDAAPGGQTPVAAINDHTPWDDWFLRRLLWVPLVVTAIAGLALLLIDHPASGSGGEVVQGLATMFGYTGLLSAIPFLIVIALMARRGFPTSRQGWSQSFITVPVLSVVVGMLLISLVVIVKSGWFDFWDHFDGMILFAVMAAIIGASWSLALFVVWRVVRRLRSNTGRGEASHA